MTRLHPILLALDPAARDLAQRITTTLPETDILDPQDMASFGVAACLRAHYLEGHPILGICAAGILIRALAPVIADKHKDPPIIAIAAKTRWVIPLLGSHQGGNRLAAQIATIVNGQTVITTASDDRLGLAFDDPPPGWRLAKGTSVKDFTAKILTGRRASLQGQAPWLEDITSPDGDLEIITGPSFIPRQKDRLIYHPAVLAIGIGCERLCSLAELRKAVTDALAKGGWAEEAIAVLVSIDLKANEPAIHALAHELGVPARFFPRHCLADQEERLKHPSEIVRQAVGVAGVAEAAALAAVGADGELVLEKCVTGRATIAIARAREPICPETIGRPQGRLLIIGLGPGGAGERSLEASRALAAADDLVGYQLYIDLALAGAPQAQHHPFPLGAEIARAYHALSLASTGRAVALLSSGDPAIYAMASVVLSLLDRKDISPSWQAIDIAILPGISAMQAASARVGALLGHDFCAISLSDLLTDWTVIETRLRAAAAADFVVALYNPGSSQRSWQFDAALTILREARPAQTPVVIARALGRHNERVCVTRLAEIQLTELPGHEIDMLTIVLIGSRSSRMFQLKGGRSWVYTPRSQRLNSKETAISTIADGS